MYCVQRFCTYKINRVPLLAAVILWVFLLEESFGSWSEHVCGMGHTIKDELTIIWLLLLVVIVLKGIIVF